jgi:hypothetical protein
MGPDIEELRKNYESFDDDKIVRVATEEATGLRPEALELLKQIIKERGLSPNVTKGVDAQFKQTDEKTLNEYCDLLRKLPCPVCNGEFEKLNATITATVISFLVMTNYRKEFKIACPDCLDKLNKNATIKSALMGWWGFPWGLIRTPKALMFNSKMKKEHHNPEANDIFRTFVLQRVGRIEANRHNKDGLIDIIQFIR